MILGTKIASERKKNHLSADDVANLCKVSRSYITLIENGRRMPGRKVIPALAAALKIKTNILINWYLEDMREKLS
jgi:transcriptional regulator with XRE-family HTH domain